MILIDYSNLVHRLLWTCIKEAKPRKKHKKYITSEYSNVFRHFIFNNIRLILKKYKTHDVIICTDDKKNWRKDFYPAYKAHRKKDRDESLVNYDEVRLIIDETVKVMREYFPIKVIGVHNAEADDVIAVLTKKFHINTKIIVVSEDKDFKQLLRYKNVQLYRPIKKQFEECNNTELDLWEHEHIIMGDKSDNVPRIVDETEFTSDFWKYLSSEEISVNGVYEFNTLHMRDKLINDFTKTHPGKNVFKPVRFGPVALKKFLENYDENMNSNPLFKEHYKRNEVLVMFDFIPEIIQNEIIKTYNEANISFDYIQMQEYFKKHFLSDLYLNAQDFLISLNNKPKNTMDW